MACLGLTPNLFQKSFTTMSESLLPVEAAMFSEIQEVFFLQIVVTLQFAFLASL